MVAAVVFGEASPTWSTLAGRCSHAMCGHSGKVLWSAGGVLGNGGVAMYFCYKKQLIECQLVSISNRKLQDILVFSVGILVRP